MPIDQPVAVAPVVVQAARLPAAAGDPAFSIMRLDPTVLSVNERLDDALSSAPGFSLFRRTSSLGANPTTQGVSLRGIAGSGASRALVTLDGAPQNDPFGGWVIWTGLPPEAIASATLVRGSGAGPYGAGALTGVVALEQPSHVDGGAAGEIAVGDRGYERAAGVAEVDEGPTRIFLDASGEHSDGWIPVIQGRGAADRPLTLRDWSAAERVETDVGRAVLSERVAAYEEDRGAGVLYANSRARGVQGSLTLVSPPGPGVLGWRLQTWVTRSDLANTSASVPAGRNTATLANNQYATPATGVGVNAAVRRAEAAYSWEFGLDVRDYEGESREHLYNQGAPTGSRVSGGGELVAGVYAEGSRDLAGFLLTGGVRLDGWEDYASRLIQTGNTVINERPGDRGGVAPTGRIGLRRDLSQALYLRAAAYAGFRPATLNELHRPFRVGNDVTEANAALSPERLYGAEVGVGGQGPVRWDGDVFYNQLANAITNVTIGKGPGTFPLAGYVPAGGTLYERENAGAVNAYGVEGEAGRAFGPTLDLRAAFTYTHARVDGGARAPQLTGLRPAETPAATVTADLAWRPVDVLTLTGEVRYESARFDDDQNTRKIDAGAGVNARAEWRLAKAVGVYVAADNLFNARIETGRSAANIVTYDAPRMVRVGLTLRR
ncbi:MAG: TonB-dependent receptor [Caulobacteraceae bacterium]|nr:TonB-dependent receptor [Caulobacteraceae bacterium]